MGTMLFLIALSGFFEEDGSPFFVQSNSILFVLLITSHAAWGCYVKGVNKREVDLFDIEIKPR
ncbi:hypothetical protein J14TS5_41380 [Paenibacillus lautus]|nr:hypothetical protein J14TS5_41380 [Paenibacillus lautus]